MRKVSRPLGLCLLVATLVLAGVLTGAVAGLFSSPAQSKSSPLALAKQSDRDIPGTGEANGSEGPTSASDEEFQQLAYPNTDVTADQLSGMQSAFAAIKAKGVGTGKNSTSQWFSLGPSKAIYPPVLNRHGSQYVTSGRTTASAIAPNCTAQNCRLYVGAAGGGIWRTDDALSGTPHWTYMSSSFAINSIGSIALDPSDSTGNTLYVGTGEFNACGSGCVAGVGIYKSTDGGNTWTGPLGNAEFKFRGVGSIAVDPTNAQVIYAGSGRALSGASSVCCDGAVTLVPGAPQWGLYKSTDGGSTWTFIHNGAATTACGSLALQAGNGSPCSPRGVRRVVVDPVDNNTIYAGSYARGIWRSSDAGATWTQIKAPLSTVLTTDRPELAVTQLASGDTRMYVAEGHTGAGGQFSRVFRSDSVRTGAPTFTTLTSNNPADPGYGTFNYCTGQCWYDNFVVTPAGHPDIVYVGGSFNYGEAGGISNARGVVLSTDAGQTWTDMTEDATSPTAPNGLHPDQHTLVTNPSNPFEFIETSDGGVVRSNGTFSDTSSRCDSRGLSEPSLSRCKQLLSRVPTMLTSLNNGLSTLQFQSLSVNPANVKNVQGGTQDNGTWETTGSSVVWNQIMYGDGGQSGFDVGNPAHRFNNFFGQFTDSNFQNGDPTKWVVTSGPLFAEGSMFYKPQIADPVVGGTIYSGEWHVWRTQDWGGNQANLEANCPEFTTPGNDPACGDFEPLGGPAGGNTAGSLVGTAYGPDRTGLNVAAVERSTLDSSTLWAATSTGRLFISKNADANPASSVTYTRLDSLASNDPNRFISSIYPKSDDANAAYVSYSGFNSSTPLLPGHVFLVQYNQAGPSATWTDLSYNLADLPITDLVRDDVTGDLYASSDFGVMRLANGSTTWTLAANGMPNVEVAGLTIVPSKRKLFAATHGLGAWSLTLP